MLISFVLVQQLVQVFPIQLVFVVPRQTADGLVDVERAAFGIEYIDPFSYGCTDRIQAIFLTEDCMALLMQMQHQPAQHQRHQQADHHHGIELPLQAGQQRRRMDRQNIASELTGQRLYGYEGGGVACGLVIKVDGERLSGEQLLLYLGLGGQGVSQVLQRQGLIECIIQAVGMDKKVRADQGRLQLSVIAAQQYRFDRAALKQEYKGLMW